jgi:hypothetical protein
MKPDMTHLLTCLENRDQETRLSRLQGLNKQDWESVQAAASRYGVEPVLYHALKPFFSDLDIPEGVRQRLREIYYISLARNLRLYEELSTLLGLLEGEHIPVILLKGAHLAEFVYQNPGLRPMNDLDLLVKRSDLSRIHEGLFQHGYESREESPGKCLEHVAPYFKQGAMKIDVHFNITRPPLSERFDVEELWARAETRFLGKARALSLCPEDLLLHLCAHTCVHHVFDNGLIPYLDAQRVLEHFQDDLDWEELWTRAEKWGLDRAVAVMLMITDKLLGLPDPDKVFGRIKPDPEMTDSLDMAMNLIQDRGQGGSMVSPFVARLFNRKGRRIRLKLIFRLLFPAKEIMFRTGQGLVDRSGLKKYFIYLKRLRSLGHIHGRALWLGLRRDPDTVRAIESQNRKNNLRDWLVREE